MGLSAPGRLIVESPYEEPARHWQYDRDTNSWHLEDGRRPAGYIVATPGAGPSDPGTFIPLPLVNRIRDRVHTWRAAGYPGTTGITRRLLEYWRDPEPRPDRRLFFCQIEAIETLIWWVEAPAAERVGIEVPGDGGLFPRLCAKMATGSGKTVVMAMVIAWQVLNKGARPQDPRFSRDILVVAPGLTVRDRLQVLVPDGDDQTYQEFDLVPPGLADGLRQSATCRVHIANSQSLGWATADQLRRTRSVDKRGPKSDRAWLKEVLTDFSHARNILVLNDEAHHAWRVPPGSRVRGVDKEELQQATRWMQALDRLHRVCGVLACYDFSATPIAPTASADDTALFGWIVSDFGLEDAIESGLVKTPRVPMRSDAPPDTKTLLPKLFHLYADAEVREDLNRPAPETAVLPALVVNAYTLLGLDWLDTAHTWAAQPTPPVMITVANRTETAARIKYAFDHGHVPVAALCDPARTLHIDSKVLDKAETAGDGGQAEGPAGAGAPDPRRNKAARAQWLRRQVNTVGRAGEPGGPIQHVISVGMLSEGWDAKTVTHILGLRAFTSQLLCEQVVGRGLRRRSYEVGTDGLLAPEYVNVFGVPFRFLPHEGDAPPAPPPGPVPIRIEPLAAKRDFEMQFPNVVRIDRGLQTRLDLDLNRLAPLELDSERAVVHADMFSTLQGNPHPFGWTHVELESFARRTRLQTVLFDVARRIYDQMAPSWRGSRAHLLGQVVTLVERFMRSEALVFKPASWGQDELRRKVLLMVEMNRVVGHVWTAIEHQNAETLEPVFDERRAVRSTGDMQAWFTRRPSQWAEHSHINRAVYDSTWEASEAYALDHSPHVTAWAKNDHLGFEVGYVFQGAPRRYRPDFLVRLSNGTTLVLEVKGQDSAEARAKRDALNEWVEAINAHGAFGNWAAAVSFHPKDIVDIVDAVAHAPNGSGSESQARKRN